MITEMDDLVKLLKDRNRLNLKRYEMGEITFRQLEHQMKDNLVPLTPDEERATSLWGIPIHFDNKLPVGEIKPVYA